MNAAEFDLWMRAELDAVERALERSVPPGAPAGLGEAAVDSRATTVKSATTVRGGPAAPPVAEQQEACRQAA